jgi:alpha-tubulin suppressor-like RCC1 family protein
LGFDNSKYPELIIKNKSILTQLNNLWQINPEEIKKVRCGWNNTYLLKNNGELYSTGVGKLGQLGFLNQNGVQPEISYEFRRVNFSLSNHSDNVFIDNIFTGSDFSYAIDSGKKKIYF